MSSTNDKPKSKTRAQRMNHEERIRCIESLIRDVATTLENLGFRVRVQLAPPYRRTPRRRRMTD